jgi:hypothetical protein
MLKRAVSDLAFVGDLPVRGRSQRLAVWTVGGPTGSGDGQVEEDGLRQPVHGSADQGLL